MIGRRAISSLRWMGSAKLLGQGFSWVVTLLLIRILTPADYGLMAIAIVIVGFTALFQEFGLGSALVQKPTLETGDVEQVFGVLLLVNLALFALLYLIAGSIAGFFDEPRVEPVMQALALKLPLSALATVPMALLRRRMEFQRKAVVDFLAIVSTSVATLVFAFRGYGVWALVIGNLLSPLVQVTGAAVAARFWVFPHFSLTGMRHLFGFGGVVTVDRILWFFYTRADDFIVGKLLGKEALGVYFVAKRLAQLPMKKVSGVINEVSFSAYSRVQEDRQRIRSLYLKGVRVASLIAFPVSFMLAGIAPVMVNVIISDKWAAAIVPLQLLSLTVPLRQLYALTTPVLMGVGRPGVGVRNVLTACVLMTIGFLAGVQWGVVGVAAAWLLVFPLQFGIALWRSLPVLGIGYLEYLAMIAPAALCSTIMFLLLNIARVSLEGAGVSGAAALPLLILIGGGAYLGLITALSRDALSEVATLVRK